MLNQPLPGKAHTAVNHHPHLQAAGDSLLDSHANLPLPRGRIDLWITSISAMVDTLSHAYEQLLSATEEARYRSFCFARDRRRFLVTRALARTVLARYLGRQPEELSFRARAYGRPELGAEAPCSMSLSFNLSHTDDLVVLAVTRAGIVGVDVESGSRKRLLASVCTQFLSHTERQSLAVLSSRCREDRLLALWTLKEAYTKARGLGLALPLRQIAFDLLSGAHLRAHFGPDVEDAANRWQFRLLKDDSGHLFSLCVERGTDMEQVLAARRILPFHSDESCHLSLLHASS